MFKKTTLCAMTTSACLGLFIFSPAQAGEYWGPRHSNSAYGYNHPHSRSYGAAAPYRPSYHTHSVYRPYHSPARHYARPYAYTNGYAASAYSYGTSYSAPASYATSTINTYASPGYVRSYAYVPVLTYKAVPVRVYYTPQQPVYYNVPAYAVADPDCPR